RDRHRAFEHEPGRRVALADIEDNLARREAARFAAGKTLRRLDLRRIEYGKQLVTTRLRKAHRMAPLRGTRPAKDYIKTPGRVQSRASRGRRRARRRRARHPRAVVQISIRVAQRRGEITRWRSVAH